MALGVQKQISESEQPQPGFFLLVWTIQWESFLTGADTILILALTFLYVVSGYNPQYQYVIIYGIHRAYTGSLSLASDWLACFGHI